MDYAVFAGVVVNGSVIFARDVLARPISGGGNGRPPLAAADDFNATMIDGDRLLLSF